MVLVLLAACGGGAGGAPGGTGSGGDDRGVGRLGKAITAVATARAVALGGAAAPTREATALDRADGACATGERNPARAARPKVAASATATALRRLSDQTATYAADLAELHAATDASDALKGEQVAALGRVLQGGQAETAALVAFQKGTSALWPTYLALDAAQRTWLERRTTGWYRSASEAADAYTVLTDPLRARLASAREQLATRDAALARATAKQDAVLAQADRSLDALR